MSRRHERKAARDLAEAPRPEPAEERCALCLRPIPAGAKSSRHHLTPRLRGGTHKGTVRLHQICHSAIHARWTETELARRLTEVDTLRSAPELTDFLSWVATKPPGSHAPTRTARGRSAKWK
ncbi:restriction endonuclease [Roseomonas sp. CCTCC AB2023176]|uniref:restriction endonuclease n=1 Tax=Roseomonas sp. CCTCC AB2023176 TaxID=3342640 RepID=UPI0035E31176